MDMLYSDIDNEKEKREARIWAFVLHLVLLFFLIFPFGNKTEKPKNFEGIIVDFGQAVGEPTFETKEKIGAAKAVALQEEKKKKSSSSKTLEVKAKPVKQIISKTVQKEESIQANEEPAKELAKPDTTLEEQVDSQTQKETAEAIEEQKAEQVFNDAKSKFSDLLTNAKSKGQDVQADQGDPLGAPDVDSKLGNHTSGGSHGKGISNRTIIYRPVIQDDSQKEGRVVVHICVNAAGKVISADFKQKGSTTTDYELIKLAKDGALKYKFSPANQDEQCGSINIDFVLRS